MYRNYRATTKTKQKKTTANHTDKTKATRARQKVGIIFNLSASELSPEQEEPELASSSTATGLNVEL